MRRMLFTISFLLMAACGGRQINYGGYSPSEERPVCHLAYHMSDWYGEDKTLTLWRIYDRHIGMHPSDYWGKCKEEDIKELPETEGWSEEDEETLGLSGRRRWRNN